MSKALTSELARIKAMGEQENRAFLLALTPQTAFDLMVQHMRDQKYERSVQGKYGACTYRGPQGLACAVGALLSDAVMASGAIEEPANVDEVFELLCVGPTFQTVEVLDRMQALHDIGAGAREVPPDTPPGIPERTEYRWHETNTPAGFERGFAYLASMLNLTVPPLEPPA